MKVLLDDYDKALSALCSTFMELIGYCDMCPLGGEDSPCKHNKLQERLEEIKGKKE